MIRSRKELKEYLAFERSLYFGDGWAALFQAPWLQNVSDLEIYPDAASCGIS